MRHSIHLNFFVSFFNIFRFFVKSLTKELIIRVTIEFVGIAYVSWYEMNMF